VVVETGTREDLALPDGYALIERRDYGKTRLWFIEGSS
jgi:16S rRNA G966 N2-methylase RsmD